MEEQKRKKLIRVIIGLIVVLIIAIAVLLWLLMNRPPESVPAPAPAPAPADTSGGLQPTSPVVSAPVTTPDVEPDTPVPPPTPPDNEASLKRVAMAFAERYGSYSNESDFVNLLDLKTLMTDAMAARTDTFVANARASYSADSDYAGTVTRSLTAEADSFNATAGRATVTVKTQRRESTGLGQDRVYYQGITLDFIKDGNAWKVNQASWGEPSDVAAE